MIEIHERVGLNIILSLKLCVYFMLLVKLYCRNKFLWVYYVIKPIWPDDDGWKSLTRPFMLLLMKIAQQRVSLSRVVIKSVHLFAYMYLRLKTTYINIEEFQDWGQTKEKKINMLTKWLLFFLGFSLPKLLNYFNQCKLIIVKILYNLKIIIIWMINILS